MPWVWVVALKAMTMVSLQLVIDHGECIVRHNHLRDRIFATTASTRLSPTKEDRAFLSSRHSRSADIIVPSLICGLPAAIDMSGTGAS